MVTTVAKAVIVKGKLYGVAAVDIPLADLLTDVVEFGKSKSYAMVIDLHGKVLVHPLLPKPSDTQSNLIDVTIQMLEPSEQLEKEVFDKMKKGESGDVTLYAPTIAARGVTSREGVIVEYKNLTYHYKKVNQYFW